MFCWEHNCIRKNVENCYLTVEHWSKNFLTKKVQSFLLEYRITFRTVFLVNDVAHWSLVAPFCRHSKSSINFLTCFSSIWKDLAVTVRLIWRTGRSHLFYIKWQITLSVHKSSAVWRAENVLKSTKSELHSKFLQMFSWIIRWYYTIVYVSA